MPDLQDAQEEFMKNQAPSKDAKQAEDDFYANANFKPMQFGEPEKPQREPTP